MITDACFFCLAFTFSLCFCSAKKGDKCDILGNVRYTPLCGRWNLIVTQFMCSRLLSTRLLDTTGNQVEFLRDISSSPSTAFSIAQIVPTKKN